MWLNFIICILHFLPLLLLLGCSSPVWPSSSCTDGKCFLLGLCSKWKSTVWSISLQPTTGLLNPEKILCPVRKNAIGRDCNAGTVMRGVKLCRSCSGPGEAQVLVMLVSSCPLCDLVVEFSWCYLHFQVPAFGFNPKFILTSKRHSWVPVYFETLDGGLAGLLTPEERDFMLIPSWYIT